LALAGGVIAALMIVIGLRLGQGSRRVSEPLEQVGRERLVLREGRWMKTDKTNLFTGLMVDFYPDGTLQSRSAVSNGLLHGVSEGWWTNAVLAVRETFREGRSHGVRTKWDIEARRISETDIREGRIDGFHREWHTNGQLAVEAAMASGLPSGRSRRWSPDGALVGQWSLSNGVVVTSMTNAVELQALAQKGGTP
jgi:antitoxin component YwqK of YwqJK toxin-antitoxin module